MLIQMLAHQPQALGTIVANTPNWVWGLAAGLTWLGLSQARRRTASLMRIILMPAVMLGLSLWGTLSAFHNSSQLGYVLATWLGITAATGAATTRMPLRSGAAYDAATRSFTLPGSWTPMVMILGAFLTKYVVGVDLAMQPSLVQDSQYTLVVSILYGLFSGVFVGRAARLVRLILRPALQRDPW